MVTGPTPVRVTRPTGVTVAFPLATEYVNAPVEFEVAATVNGASPYVWFGMLKLIAGVPSGLTDWITPELRVLLEKLASVEVKAPVTVWLPGVLKACAHVGAAMMPPVTVVRQNGVLGAAESVRAMVPDWGTAVPL